MDHETTAMPLALIVKHLEVIGELKSETTLPFLDAFFDSPFLHTAKKSYSQDAIPANAYSTHAPFETISLRDPRLIMTFRLAALLGDH